MITVFDSSNYAQQIFLAEAYATLAGRAELSQEEIDAGRFLSLDGYFAHIDKLVSLHPKYVLIPSDENPFEIDANTRTIKVPASFSKCAGVVGDNMCEIITFTIDRYFDYVDLANAHICVQWKLPDGEEGISHIGLIDLNTASGKIRFGWPLTDALTKNAGNITFSVRFYVEKVIVDKDNLEQSQFVYLFNTLPATVPIKAGLNFEGEDVFVEQGISDLFKNFVSHSANPSFPMPKPVAYTDNLVDQAKVDEDNDTLILRAQATTSDNGWVTYKWYLKEGVSDKTDTSAIAMEIETTDFFKVDHKDYQPVKETNWAKLPKNKQYYVTTDTNDAEAYKQVAYKLVDGVHTFTEIKSQKPVEEGTPLYERFTKLTILPRSKDEDGAWITPEGSKKITGLYHVEAVNSVGKDSVDVTYTTKDVNGNDVTLAYSIPGINSTPPLDSNECYVPTPAIIKIEDKNNLVHDTFIDPVNKALLKVVPEKDSGNPQRTYVWYKYDEEDIIEIDAGDGKKVWVAKDDTALPIEVARGVDMVNYITNVPGWYFAEIISLLNRDTKEINSNISRVINPTVQPKVMKMTYTKWRDEDIENGKLNNDAVNPIYVAEEINDGKGEYIDEDGIQEASFGDIYQLKVEIQDGFDSKLTSDGVTYKWFMMRPEDKNPIEVNAEMTLDLNGEIYQINEVDTAILNIRCKRDENAVKSAVVYYCEVTNTLAEQTATFGRDDYKVMFLVH